MSRGALRIGIKLNQQVFPMDAQREAWGMADDAGFDHLWLFDHLLAIHQEPVEPIFDGWTTLGAMAVSTTRARIGLNVTGNLYRHPGLLAKMAVTVDHLSNGRLEMGLGAGWSEAEFRMYGLAFPGPADRVRMLEEACQVMERLWTERQASFDGRFYQLRDAIAMPKPMQRPHLPLWIGGNGPKRTLRVAARHADVWSCDVWPTNVAAIAPAHALAKILDEHCVKVGRDPKTIRRAHVLIDDGRETALEIAQASVRAGFTDFLIFPAQASSTRGDLRAGVETAAKLLPRLRALAA